jgi:hypothetical protein
VDPASEYDFISDGSVIEMAKNNERKHDLREDALVERLVADPANPEAKLLSGYLGKSDREGVWRVYLSLEFNDYLEIAEAEILHVEKLRRDDASQAGAWIWMKPDAVVEHVRPERRTTQGEFLSGEISGRFLGASAGGGLDLGFLTLVAALQKTFSVTECATCPTNDGKHTCVPAVCTLATSCSSKVLFA